uniref:ATP synthase CF1 subunit delta n=1 Tax=Antithamnion hubbsii TaxID=1005974 RepID=A0A4D6WK76_9FLOR|nr:ATP synthase CF1 subunit delta [Antithamnion hubbsii]
MSQNTLYKISSPYAEALLELSLNNDAVNKTSQDLSLIIDMINESVDLKQFLSNPLINADTKKNVINKLFATEVSSFVLKFLLVLIDRRRISLLNIIIDTYFNLVYKTESTVLTEVSSASNLTEVQQNALIDKIKIMTNSQNVKLITTIDPSLIGGFIIKIGSKVIDASLSGKLKQLAFYLETN